MSSVKSIHPSEKSNSLWSQLVFKLATMFEGTLDIVFPEEWNEQYFSWFRILEENSFRQELRYSFQDVATILEHPDVVFCFVTMDGEPQIFLLGYSLPHEAVKSFYLDTLAVRRRGHGIGHVVMEFLIRWARTKQYQTIILNTEATDEKGMSLQQFYAKHGFTILAQADTGNITMRCVL